ncbi:hypothetical protein CRYUN_Cryun37aG0013600 [Craigia yunnanensis]
MKKDFIRLSLELLQPVSNSVWKAPNIGSIKLNVDAAYYPAIRETSLGMVVHDHPGEVHIYAIIKVEKIESPLQAKLKAILFGFKEAPSIQQPFFIVESDSLLAVREIKKKKDSFCEWESIILDIIKILREFSSCMFSHSRRSANSCAHNMARLATVVGEYNVWRNSWPILFCNPDNS